MLSNRNWPLIWSDTWLCVFKKTKTKNHKLIEHNSDCLKSFFNNIGFLSPALSVLSHLCLCELLASVQPHMLRPSLCRCDSLLPTSLNSFGAGPVFSLGQGQCSTTSYCHVPYPPLKSLYAYHSLEFRKVNSHRSTILSSSRHCCLYLLRQIGFELGSVCPRFCVSVSEILNSGKMHTLLLNHLDNTPSVPNE